MNALVEHHSEWLLSLKSWCILTSDYYYSCHVCLWIIVQFILLDRTLRRLWTVQLSHSIFFVVDYIWPKIKFNNRIFFFHNLNFSKCTAVWLYTRTHALIHNIIWISLIRVYLEWRKKHSPTIVEKHKNGKQQILQNDRFFPTAIVLVFLFSFIHLYLSRKK